MIHCSLTLCNCVIHLFLSQLKLFYGCYLSSFLCSVDISFVKKTLSCLYLPSLFRHRLAFCIKLPVKLLNFFSCLSCLFFNFLPLLVCSTLLPIHTSSITISGQSWVKIAPFKCHHLVHNGKAVVSLCKLFIVCANPCRLTRNVACKRGTPLRNIEPEKELGKPLTCILVEI